MKLSSFTMAGIFMILAGFWALFLIKRDKLTVGTKHASQNNSTATTNISQNARLRSYAARLEAYAKKRSFNSSVCFLVDMSVPAGKKRFFIYDLKKHLVKNSGLVAHGAGSFRTENPVFSNTPNSGCSSLGKYKIGHKYPGRFGKAFKLYGLDSSNSNAYNRFIVLHYYSCVPDIEVYPQAICNSLGCPMVSENFFKKVAAEVELSKKPLLLWVIN